MISIYAHTTPEIWVHEGVSVKQGDIIPTIADTRSSNRQILSHLHYTLGRASGDIDYGQFAWNDMRNPSLVGRLNPLRTICDPYI